MTSVVNWLGAFKRDRDGGDKPPSPAIRAGRIVFEDAEETAPDHATQATAGPVRAGRLLFDEPPVDEPEIHWSPARLRFARALWGEGFIGPGGVDEALLLSKSLGLTGTHSLLNLGGGLGGAARCLSNAYGSWVTGLETDPALVAAAAAMAAKTKDKKAEVKLLDPARPVIKKGYFHHALGQEALWPLADKEPLIAGMVEGVRSQGQVVLTDLVPGPEGFNPTDPTFAAWARLERAEPHLMDERALSAMLAKNGLDIRIIEEISQRHITQTITAWASMVQDLRRDKPAAAHAAIIVEEAELWLRRLALMRQGRLRLLRWHAIRR